MEQPINNTPAAESNEPINHFMIDGTVQFRGSDPEDHNLYQAQINALISKKEVQMTVNDLQRMNQALIMNFMAKMGGQENQPNVVDVIIHNIVYLGFMPMSQFRQKPSPEELEAQAKQFASLAKQPAQVQ